MRIIDTSTIRIGLRGQCEENDTFGRTLESEFDRTGAGLGRTGRPHSVSAATGPGRSAG